MRSVNPATGELVREYADHTREEALSRLSDAATAQASWERIGLDERAALLERVAEVLERRADELARTMALEMGKPLAEGRAEVAKCAWGCRHYAAHAARYLADETIATEAAESTVLHRPLGVVLAIMPWNFPLWQVFRFAAPTLMAGNGVLLKHAPNVTGCALAIEECLAEAGLPPGLLACVFVDVDLVPALIEDPRIAGVTLTGSTRAGRAVAAAAGRALKKTVLELGGSDPYLVLADADLEVAVDACATSRLLNAGQSCIAAKRLVVVDEVRPAFVEGICERFQNVRVGDPLAPQTELGPLARHDLRDELDRQVRISIERGATALVGGAPLPGPGAFYPPTVLVDVVPGMPAYEEELFGPVASVLAAADERQAIELANDTRYGLGAAVFSRDIERARRIAREELRAGSICINGFVKSDPRLPFGGIRDSGFGRELSRQGLHEFVNVETLVVS